MLAWKKIIERKQSLVVPKREIKKESKLNAAALEPCMCTPTSSIEFCATIGVPSGFHTIPTAPIPGSPPTVCVYTETSNIQCQNLKCEQTIPVTVTNPCGGADIICDGKVELNKLHYCGFITLLINVEVASNNDTDPTSCPAVVAGQISKFITIPVDADICIRCEEFDCSLIGQKLLSVTGVGILVTPAICGDEDLVKVTGVITFDTSVCEPIAIFNINGSVSCETIGELPIGFIVQLIDSDTTTVLDTFVLTSTGLWSFAYNAPASVYIRYSTPLLTLLVQAGPYISAATNDIGNVSTDCAAP